MTKLSLKTIIFFILITLMLPCTTEAQANYTKSTPPKTQDTRIYTIFNKTLLNFKTNFLIDYAKTIQENVSKNAIILSVDYDSDSPKEFQDYVKFFCNMSPSQNNPSYIQFHHKFPELYNKHPGLAMTLLTHELGMFCLYIKDKAFFTKNIENRVENFMFTMDTYYIDAKFLEALYKNEPGLLKTKTQFEDFLLLSNKENNLASVSQLLLGTDIEMTYALYSYRENDKSLEDAITVFKKMETSAIDQLHYPEQDSLTNYINTVPAYTLINLGPNLLASVYFSKNHSMGSFDIKKFPEIEKSLNNLHKELEPYKSRLSYQETFKKMIEQDVHR